MKQKHEIIFYSILMIIGIIAVVLVIVLDNKTFADKNIVENNTKYTSKNEIPSSENIVDSNNNPNQLDENSNVTNSNNKENSSQSSTSNNQNNLINNNNNTNNNVNSSKNSASDNNNNNSKNDSYSQKDLLVINELNELDNQTDLLLTSGNDNSISSKAKGIFITLVDFCFYDGKIKGITFNELTDAGKTKVLKIINGIDEKIDHKFPGYKEKITSKSSEAFKKASELIKKGAQNIKEFAQEKLGDKNYQALIDEKDELVLYTKNAWSLIKNFGTSIFQKTTSKLKEWYENFRDNQ